MAVAGFSVVEFGGVSSNTTSDKNLNLELVWELVFFCLDVGPRSSPLVYKTLDAD